MGTLNPTIPSPELTKTLNAAAARMKALGKPYLTPALLLATFAPRRRQRGAPAADVAGDRAQLPPGRAGDLGRDAGEGQPRRGCGLRFRRGGRLARQALHRDAGGARRGPQHRPGRGRGRDRHRARAGRAGRTRGEHRGDPAPLRHLARDAGQPAVHPGAGQARLGPGCGRAGQGRRGGAGLRARRPDARSAGAADAGEPPPRDPGGGRGRGPAVAGERAVAADGRGQGAGRADASWCRSPRTRCWSMRRRRSTAPISRPATASSSSPTSSASSAAR